jgi:hypothetical protein
VHGIRRRGIVYVPALPAENSMCFPAEGSSRAAVPRRGRMSPGPPSRTCPARNRCARPSHLPARGRQASCPAQWQHPAPAWRGSERLHAAPGCACSGRPEEPVAQVELRSPSSANASVSSVAASAPPGRPLRSPERGHRDARNAAIAEARVPVKSRTFGLAAGLRNTIRAWASCGRLD